MSTPEEGGNVHRLRVGGRKRPVTPRATDEIRVPPDWPITALGYSVGDNGGKVLLILDASGDLMKLDTQRLGRNTLFSCFAQQPDYLRRNFPRFPRGYEGPRTIPLEPENKAVETFRPEQVADLLAAVCTSAGPLRLEDAQRGRGCWRGADDDLVVHLGHALLVNGRDQPLGRRGRGEDSHIYPRLPTLPPPGKPSATAARRLLDVFARFAWREDREWCARLLLGACACMFLSGALRHRANLFLTGPHGSGKTTLLTVLGLLFGRWLLKLEDTSAAAIYQTSRTDALPVALDEGEHRADNPAHNAAILRIMRASYTGGKLARGSVGGVATMHVLRSTFLWAGINLPPLEPQDRSRALVLELELPPQNAMLELPFGDLPTWGEALLGRVVERWDVWDATVRTHRIALQDEGLDARHADTLAEILAGAWVLTRDAEADERCLDGLGPQIERLKAEIEAAERPQWRAVLDAILGAVIDRGSGRERVTVGELLRLASGYGAGGFLSMGSRMLSDVDRDARAREDEGARDAEGVLSRAGLRLWWKPGGLRVRMVAIANNSVGLAALLARTPWAADWSTAVARAPGAVRGGPLRFRFGLARAVLVPLLVVQGNVEEDEARERDELAAATGRRQASAD